jgi:hypothetical protein
VFASHTLREGSGQRRFRHQACPGLTDQLRALLSQVHQQLSLVTQVYPQSIWLVRIDGGRRLSRKRRFCMLDVALTRRASGPPKDALRKGADHCGGARVSFLGALSIVAVLFGVQF